MRCFDDDDAYEAKILDREPKDDDGLYSFEDVYPEDVQHWRDSQNELNERGNDE